MSSSLSSSSGALQNLQNNPSYSGTLQTHQVIAVLENLKNELMRDCDTKINTAVSNANTVFTQRENVLRLEISELKDRVTNLTTSLTEKEEEDRCNDINKSIKRGLKTINKDRTAEQEKLRDNVIKLSIAVGVSSTGVIGSAVTMPFCFEAGIPIILTSGSTLFTTAFVLRAYDVAWRGMKNMDCAMKQQQDEENRKHPGHVVTADQRKVIFDNIVAAETLRCSKQSEELRQVETQANNITTNLPAQASALGTDLKNLATHLPSSAAHKPA